ncbi:MAG TPA: hypothetical protein VFW96_11315, partial [Thermomicrobiales bacterium]|nr:hypothetical protein [Thermomicrobiales bacterium]
MYLRFTTISFDPARQDEITRFADEEFLPAIRQIPGFRHYFGAVDPSTPGRGYTFSVWETAQQAEANAGAAIGFADRIQGLGMAVDSV